ncbi:methyl-accepting chemotaxis protein [Pseudomonas sp. MH9.2]|nr:methyl-accepting chemotaxis protein [Pseudomonas sp. MH9.2]MEB0024921.1 methyl-accepting chemotaxis protein [Pseudomonas sp. MH9.2]WPX71094.1 methyl-accepting chemotaxis protein [Pseudomonas sp. MH9.2]
MFKRFSQALGHVGVKAKLALGFGLLVLLTLLIALTGWHSANNMVDRGNKISAIANLSALTKDLRVNRLRYLAERNEQNSAAVSGVLERIQDNQRSLSGVVSNPVDLQLIEEQGRIVEDYRTRFSTLERTFKDRESALAKLVQSAAEITEALNEATQDLVSAPAVEDQNDTLRLSQFQAIGQLAVHIQQARIVVYSFIYTNDPSKEQGTLATIDQVTAELIKVRDATAPREQTRLMQAELVLQQYRKDVQNYAAQVHTSLETLDQMAVSGVSLEALSQKLIDSQSQARDSEAQSARQLLVISTLLALALGILAAWVITAQIVHPLLETLKAAERIAAGDLSHDIKTERRDELGQLQRSMQGMTVSLRELIGGISKGVTQIASAAEELSAVTEQTSAGVNSQRVETDQVATAMNEMTATVQEVSRNAEEASNAAAAADKEARAGEKVIGEAIDQIELLAVEVDNSNKAMNHLKEESEKIGGVLDVIKAVAQQTNLLALNAAIEAARAGEAGRGFAVVADEVRSLAQRTQKSTEEIEGLITSLQSGTQEVSTVMESSRVLTDSSVELPRRAVTSLESITRTVSTIQSMNQQIAAAAEQQSAVAEEINRSVLNVRDISEQTAGASEETAASSVELARLGNELQVMVSHFRT